MGLFVPLVLDQDSVTSDPLRAGDLLKTRPETLGEEKEQVKAEDGED